MVIPSAKASGILLLLMERGIIIYITKDIGIDPNGINN